ncbi:MAG: YraN family protein [Hirschia sp.]|nr:YraN family protein [Hirschia sp.]MBF18843.1 YraN family protein [Hirschia sp.]|tara:strand:- start:682 stop:1059 length:378 start_codon:yes stop_codon:yes gene_type:complete
MSDSRQTRQRHARERHGRNAEELAKWALRLKGYRILAHRVRYNVGEIDLIAARGKTLAFVEVKARRTLGAALDAVRPQAWMRIARTAEAWCAKHPDLADHDWRYDLMAVTPWRWPTHHPDYWRPD